MTEPREQRAQRPLAEISWWSAAIASAAAAIGIVTLVALADPAPQSAHYAVEESTEVATTVQADPLRGELARCRTLPANTDDARCSAAWEVNRRRFMGESRSYVAPAKPVPIEPTPAPTYQAAPAAEIDIPKLER